MNTPVRLIVRLTVGMAACLALVPGASALAQTAVVPAIPDVAAIERAVAEAVAAARAASVLAAAEASRHRVVVEGVADVAAEAAVLAVQAVSARPQVVVVERPAREEAARRERERALREARTEASREQSLYSRGQAALDAGRYSQALEHFAQVAALNGPRADGALYWKAYAQYKLAQRPAALETLRALQQAHPNSSWMKDARALEVEMSSPASASAATSEDDDLKLLALNSLIHADAERAIPMLEKILMAQQPPRLKKRALFVLSQNPSPKGRQILLDIAQGSSNPDLQLEALRYLGLFGGTENLRLLSKIYGTSKDIDVRRRILETYMVGGQRDLVVQAAKAESDASLRAQAVRLLGVMHATAELESLYQAEISVEVKRAIVEAYMVGGDTDRLVQVAKVERNDALRLRAIEMLGALGRGKNAAVLAGLYSAEGQTKEAKRAVINALFVAGDAKPLIDIARQETDPALRKAAVERLSLMKAKEATDFLMELINK